jgi:hypothetical protein
MADDPIVLDAHRGMMAQSATEIRRHRAEIEADQAALRRRQEELESLLAAAPAATWSEAVEKVRYLLALFAASPEALDPRRQKLIAAVLADLHRLSGDPLPPTASNANE